MVPGLAADRLPDAFLGVGAGDVDVNLAGLSKSPATPDCLIVALPSV